MTSKTVVLIPVTGQDAPDLSADVVFVHGLDGDPIDTWTGSPGFFWPKLLGQEAPNIAVWTLGYPAASSDWRGLSMPLADRAYATLSMLEAKGLGSRPLIFIVHSLGGLLVKQMIRHASELGQASWLAIRQATRGIVFLATPNSGSRIADWVNYWSLLRASSATKDLQDNDARLRELNVWFRNKVSEFGLRIQVYYEKLPVGPTIIVDEASADPGIAGVIPIPLDENHISICKPASKESLVYLQVRRFVADLVPTRSSFQRTPTAVHASKAHRDARLQVCDIGGWKPNEINSVAWSPSSRFLAVGSDDNTIRIWEPLKEDLVLSIEGHEGPVRSICWHPGERWIASTSSDGTVRTWAFPSGRLERTWNASNDWGRSIAWSKDGSYIVVGFADGTVRILDPVGEFERDCTERHDGRVRAVAISPRSQRFASGGTDGVVRIWSSTTGKLTDSVSISRAPLRFLDAEQVLCLAWSDLDDYLALGTNAGKVLLINTQTWKVVKSAKVARDSVLSLAWAPDGRELLCGSADREARRCRVEDFKRETLIGGLKREMSPKQSMVSAHQGSIRSVAWSPDGSLLATGSTDQTVKITSAHGWVALDPHDHRVRCVSASPDGRAIAIGSIGRKVSLLDLVTGAIKWQFEGATEVYASVSRGKEERVLEKRREGLDEYIQCMAWSPDGARIAAAGDDRVVRLLDSDSGQSTGMNLVDQHQGPIRKVCWSPLGKVIVSCSAGLAVIWNVESGEIQSVRAHRGDILGLCFSPCGKKFSTFGEDGVICVWFGSTFKQLATSPVEMSVLSWSPDGRYILGGGNGGLLCVWGADSGHQVAEVALGGALRFMAWEPGGKYCVASIDDGTIVLIAAREWTITETRRTLPSTHRSVGVFFFEDPTILDGELMPELLVKTSEFNTDDLQAARSTGA